MTKRVAFTPARWLQRAALPLLLATAPTLPALAQAVDASAELSAELRQRGDTELHGVYAARGYRPLWITPGRTLDPAAQELIGLVDSAAIDGVDPTDLKLGELTAAVEQLSRDGSPAARARAELALSQTFVDYVRAMRRAPAAAMTYEHQTMRPAAPRRADALWEAASAPSLTDYVREMRWMHPLYAELRRAAVAEDQDLAQIDPTVSQNLDRLRALPALGKGRSILVDAANARLLMYEGDRAVDSMKVVVGKPQTQTPMLAGYVRYAILNPYWNVPDNLVASRIAANVISRGPVYLRTAGYQVLADWSADPAPLDPAKVDWRAVAKGEQDVRVRQRPGAGNAMGKIKFEFPNPLGIYLHDTPEKNLMLKDKRQFSNGCVRLEDAERLGRWLFSGALPTAGEAPEQRVDLPELVPIYITYLTAQVEGGRIALAGDPYGRDAAANALASTAPTTATVASR